MKTSYRLSEAAFRLDGKMPLKQAIPLGLQHVLAMFVGNLTPLLIITGACGIAGGEFADLQLQLLQNAMLVAGIVTLVQLFAIGPVGRRALMVGRAALIRPSSVIVVPSSGTLKSARTRTRLPLRSPRSLSVFMYILS